MKMERKRAEKTHKEQYALYVSFIERNRPFALGKLEPTMPQDYFHKKWEELSEVLNSCGSGPSRTVDAWKAIITSWRNQVRAKARKINSYSKLGSVDGPMVNMQLSELEERALSVWGTVVDNHPPTHNSQIQHLNHSLIQSNMDMAMNLSENCNNSVLERESIDSDIPEINHPEQILQNVLTVLTVPESPVPPSNSRKRRRPKDPVRDLIDMFKEGMAAQSKAIQDIASAIDRQAAAAERQAIAIENMTMTIHGLIAANACHQNNSMPDSHYDNKESMNMFSIHD